MSCFPTSLDNGYCQQIIQYLNFQSLPLNTEHSIGRGLLYYASSSPGNILCGSMKPYYGPSSAHEDESKRTLPRKLHPRSRRPKVPFESPSSVLLAWRASPDRYETLTYIIYNVEGRSGTGDIVLQILRSDFFSRNSLFYHPSNL